VRGNARVLLREAQERGVRTEPSSLAGVVKPWRENLAAWPTVRFENTARPADQVDLGKIRSLD
jgi:hypothetical protein